LPNNRRREENRREIEEKRKEKRRELVERKRKTKELPSLLKFSVTKYSYGERNW
jgi:hypothetical protein